MPEKNKTYFAEPKGSKTTIAIKEYFYFQLAKPPHQQWEIYSIILDKVDLLNHYEKPFDPHRLYNILPRESIERINFSHVKENIELFVDKCKGRNERALFDSFIKNNLEPLLPINISINIQHKLSHDLAGLQTVDLFCYGISRKHALNDRQWYQIFSRHITEEITWKAKLA